MENGVVSLVKSTEDDLKSSITKALDLVEFKTSQQAKNVIIKPNLCYYWDSSTGYTTDPRIVGSIIDVLRENYGLGNANIRIAEADATAMRTLHAFKMLRYDRLATEKNVTLLNLTEDRTTVRKVNVRNEEMSFTVPNSILEADLFVNVPKIKIMSRTLMTCAMKNMFGCIAIPRKIAYHSRLIEAIVGINKILKPNVTIVDGLTALSNHPLKMNLIIAGANTLSVDYIVAKIIGYSPFWVRYLKLGAKEGLGDFKKVRIKGENWKEFNRIFPKIHPLRLRWQSTIQLGILKLYSRVVGDVIPPFLEA